MKPKGIRILDKISRVVSVELPDILKEIENGDSLHWSILYLEAQADYIGENLYFEAVRDYLGEDGSIPEFEEKIRTSEKGFFINWRDLNALAIKFHQVIDIMLIGCKDKKALHRYDNDQERYETCNIVIDMIDSGYWEVFSKDEKFIDRLAAKFEDVKSLTPDFEK
jgi:hypothetical protein